MQQHLQDIADAGDAYPESPSYYFDFDAFEAHYSGDESDEASTPGESGSDKSQSRQVNTHVMTTTTAHQAPAQAPTPAPAPAPASESPVNEPYDLYALEAQVAATRSRYDAYYKTSALPLRLSSSSSSSSSSSASSFSSFDVLASSCPRSAPSVPSSAPPEKENLEACWAAGMSRDRAIVRAGITAMHRRIREAGDCVITDYGQYMMLCEQQRARTDWHQIAVKETNMMQALYRGSMV